MYQYVYVYLVMVKSSFFFLAGVVYSVGVFIRPMSFSSLAIWIIVFLHWLFFDLLVCAKNEACSADVRAALCKTVRTRLVVEAVFILAQSMEPEHLVSAGWSGSFAHVGKYVERNRKLFQSRLVFV